jgi:alanine racemase
VSRLIRAVIDTDALRSNLKALRRCAPGARVVAVVKANAYGHGLIPAALALSEADAFGVARIDEGIALRAAGIAQPIVLLEGIFTSEELAEAARAHLTSWCTMRGRSSSWRSQRPRSHSFCG